MALEEAIVANIFAIIFCLKESLKILSIAYHQYSWAPMIKLDDIQLE